MHTITFLASTCGHTPRCTLWKNTANQCKPTQCALFCTVASVSHTPNPHDCMQAQPNLRKAVLTLSAAWNLFLQRAGCALQRRADWWVERVCTAHCTPPRVYPSCTQAWLVALSHYRREPTSSQRTAYTCLPTETNLTSSNFL